MKKQSRTATTVGAALALTLAATLTGCTGPETDAEAGGTPTAGAGSAFPTVEIDQELHDSLPQAIQDAGVLKGASITSAPYYFQDEATGEWEGIVRDLSEGVGAVLGVEVDVTAAGSPSDMTAGITSGRYDVQMNPTGDTLGLEESSDFVNWLELKVGFAVPVGNPDGIDGLESLCGLSVGAIAGGSAEQVVQKQSETCAEDGERPIEVSAYKSQSDSILALTSGRIDAAFGSEIPLRHYVSNFSDTIEYNEGSDGNGYADSTLGMLLPKGSELAPVLLEVVNRLMENGYYDALLEKYDITSNALDSPVINGATS